MTKTKTQHKRESRIRRHRRTRTRVFGTAKRPRLAIFRSNKGIYAQLIDDEKGVTLAAAAGKQMTGKTPIERARKVGEAIAKAAKGKKVSSVVFDRGGFMYTGQVAEVAEGAREGGLKF